MSHPNKSPIHLFHLSKDPVVAYYLYEWRLGNITWEQALLNMAVHLAQATIPIEMDDPHHPAHHFEWP